MYEANNSGIFYNVGYLLGLLFVWGNGARGTTYVVKNYYNTPREEANTRKNSGKLSEEDHKTIGSIVEEKLKFFSGKDKDDKKKGKK